MGSIKSPKKILVMCAAFPPRGKGGGPLSSYLFAKALMDSGYQVKVLTVGDDDNDEVYDGVAVSVVKSPNVYWDYLNKHYSIMKKVFWHILENFNPIAYFRFKKEINSFDPDVVVTISIENINVASWLAAKHLNKKIVHVLHSYFIFCYEGGQFHNNKGCNHGFPFCKLLSIGKVSLSKNVDVVMGETDFVINEHIKHGIFKDIPRVTIPSPVTFDVSSPPKKRTGSLKVGYMGVLEEHKGLSVIANAAEIIGKDNNIQFMIAGTGRNEQYVNAIKEQFNKASTTFMGWVKPEEAYPLFDVLIVSSLWKEPFGRIVAEAMRYGIPVIAAESGGITENIVDGENGFLYEASNEVELAEKINLIAADEPMRLRMANYAKEYASKFSFNKYQKNLKDFFDNQLAILTKQ